MREKLKARLSRRSFLRAGVFAAAGTAAAGIVDTGIEPGQLAVARVSVPLPALPPGFDGYRIVQLTDLHFGPAIAKATITRALWLTDDLAPDLVVITGDFITYYLEEKPLRRALDQLDAPDGVWAVLGNHDHWFDPDGVRRVLGETGVAELRNANTAITRGDDTLWLAGVDDIWVRQHDLDAALDGIPPGATAILLAHEPDYADEVAPVGRVSLQLSGHSHGGQIRVPVRGGPYLSDFLHLARKYPHGLYKIDDMWLYTSAGVGRGPIPRVFASPEVTEITLVRSVRS